MASDLEVYGYCIAYLGVDPELSKTDNIKKEEERLRASVRRENQQRRTRERGHGRGRLDASFLDDGAVSINAIKSSYKVCTTLFLSKT